MSLPNKQQHQDIGPELVFWISSNTAQNTILSWTSSELCNLCRQAKNVPLMTWRTKHLHVLPYEKTFVLHYGYLRAVHWAQTDYSLSAGQHAILPEVKVKTLDKFEFRNV